MQAERKDDPRAIQEAIALAELKRSQGKLYEAYLDYQAIASWRIGADYVAADLTIFKSLADLAILFGHFQAADLMLEGIEGICHREGNLHRADFATLKRIHLALDRGHLRQASSLFEVMEARIGNLQDLIITPQGLKTWENRCQWPNTYPADRQVMLAHLYLEMGRLLNGLGQYRDALEVLHRGRALATPGDSQTVTVLARRLVPWFELAIARTCLESGLFQEATVTLESLQGFLGSDQERVLQIQWYTLAGKLALLQGEFGQALAHFEAMTEICHGLQVLRGVAIATLNLAQVLIVLNQNQSAAEHLADLKPDVERLNDAHLTARFALLQRLARARSQSLVAGSTFSVSEILADAPSDSEAAIPEEDLAFLRTQVPNYLTWFEDRVLEFQWYLSQSQLDAAAQMLRHIQEVFAPTDSHLIHLKMKVLQGTLSYYQGLHQLQNGDEAIGRQRIRWAALALDEIRPHLAAMQLLPEQWQAQRVLGWCLMRLNAPIADQAALAAETTQLLDALTQSLPPNEQVLFLLNKWTADEEFIVSQIAQLQQRQQQLQQAPWHRRLSLRWQLWGHLNALMTHIDRYKDALAKRTLQSDSEATAQARVPSVWKRLLRHPWRRATLSFLVLPDQVLVIRNWRFGLDFAVLPTTRLELHNLVKQWYTAQETRYNSRAFSLQPEAEEGDPPKTLPQQDQISQQLADKLHLAEVLALPKHIRHLAIVPDDILHILPFAAMRHDGKYLVESYALSIAYETWSAPSAKPSASPQPQTLLVGVSQGKGAFAALPGVDAEIAILKTLLTQQKLSPTVLVNDAAQKTSLLTELPSASLWHMACHGTFQHNRADQSGLVLDPMQEPPQVLSLREISQMNLEHVRHVTLSACSSADHLVLPGRWVISLPETLWRSGVNSVLGSLWEVYDQLAIPFMQRFYTYLQTLPRDEALRRTQLDCLQQKLQVKGIANAHDPVYWAGFNLYGTQGRL